METVTADMSQHVDDFGQYWIVKTLGEGGMGTVYLAEQTVPIRRRVALKVVKLGMDTNQVLARFNHERQSLARMDHTNIARILDAGASSRGRPFFVMDYIEGEAITAYCDRHQRTVPQRLELFLPVCRAIQHAHNKGIIHRDIKPSNVMVTAEDGLPVPKVIDFGIARATDRSDVGNTLATQFGQMVGTPEYASPEQADMVGGEISAATDVYSLGVLLYEMLIGAVPFDGEVLRKAGAAEMLRIIREEEAPSLVQKLRGLGAGEEIAARRGTDGAALQKLLAGDLNSIVCKALEKSPERRYASPSQLAADIEKYLRGERVFAGPSRRSHTFRAIAGAAVAGLVLIPVAAWFAKRAVEGRRQPEAAASPATLVLSDVANNTGDRSFDSTFRQSISFGLQRSAGLNVLPAPQAAETLAQMRRAPGTAVTAEMAREMCLRTGGAAYLESTLSKAGSGYLLTLQAHDCKAGGLVDEEQSQAAGRDSVLNELDRLTTLLRSKAAASFAALQKDAVPLDSGTTSSLEALKSFTTARQRAYVSPSDGLLLFQRAVELDPEFALAYAWLGRTYADAGEQSQAMASIRKAYELRHTASDHENFFITYNYNRDVLRNLELARLVCESWIEKYPRDLMPHAFLSGFTSKGKGLYEKSIEEAEKAIQMDPGFTIGYNNIADAYLYLNRPDEVTATIQRSVGHHLQLTDHLGTAFLAGFLKGDGNAMEKAAAEMATVSSHGDAEYYRSMLHAYQGRLQQSRQESIQSVTLAREAHLVERAALFEGFAAVREAFYGYPAESSRHALAVEQIINGRDSGFPPAFALALTGNTASALARVTRMETSYPEDTCIRFIYAPALRGLAAINQGNAAKAIELLTVSKPYETAQTGVSLYVHYGAHYPTYVRGLAYQQLHQYREAAAEFRWMLDHPSLLLADPAGLPARLQLARALRDAGDQAGAKAAYHDFLNLWKDADTDIPLLRQARSEFARL